MKTLPPEVKGAIAELGAMVSYLWDTCPVRPEAGDVVMRRIHDIADQSRDSSRRARAATRAYRSCSNIAPTNRTEGAGSHPEYPLRGEGHTELTTLCSFCGKPKPSARGRPCYWS